MVVVLQTTLHSAFKGAELLRLEQLFVHNTYSKLLAEWNVLSYIAEVPTSPPWPGNQEVRGQ